MLQRSCGRLERRLHSLQRAHSKRDDRTPSHLSSTCNGHVSEHTVHLELVIAMSFRLDITARTASYSVCCCLALTLGTGKDKGRADHTLASALPLPLPYPCLCPARALSISCIINSVCLLYLIRSFNCCLKDMTASNAQRIHEQRSNSARYSSNRITALQQEQSSHVAFTRCVYTCVPYFRRPCYQRS